MRLVVAVLAVLGFVPSAVAGEFELPNLRGSNVYEPAAPTYYRWSGAYVGVQGGFANSHLTFANASSSLVAFMLRESALENSGHISQWQMLQNQDKTSTNYGGFIGYNSQWEDAIIGLELNYNRTSISGAAADTLSRGVAPGDGILYHTTVNASASMHVTDFATLRARGGYVLGRFMPYGFVGLAFGRADISRSAVVFGTSELADGTSPTTTPFGPFTQSQTKTSYIWGYDAGFGVDVALTQNIFVRGEYEFVQFVTFSDMRANINTLRLGAGLKF